MGGRSDPPLLLNSSLLSCSLASIKSNDIPRRRNRTRERIIHWVKGLLHIVIAIMTDLILDVLHRLPQKVNRLIGSDRIRLDGLLLTIQLQNLRIHQVWIITCNSSRFTTLITWILARRPFHLAERRKNSLTVSFNFLLFTRLQLAFPRLNNTKFHSEPINRLQFYDIFIGSTQTLQANLLCKFLEVFVLQQRHVTNQLMANIRFRSIVRISTVANVLCAAKNSKC